MPSVFFRMGSRFTPNDPEVVHIVDWECTSISTNEFERFLLGGELPTARFCGLVHPSFFCGWTLLIHVNPLGEITHLRAVGWATKYLVVYYHATSVRFGEHSSSGFSGKSSHFHHFILAHDCRWTPINGDEFRRASLALCQSLAVWRSLVTLHHILSCHDCLTRGVAACFCHVRISKCEPWCWNIDQHLA